MIKLYINLVERDNIKDISGKNKPGSYEIIMFWSRPANPNGGHILAYEIKINRFDDRSRYMIGNKPDQVLTYLLRKFYAVVYPLIYCNDNGLTSKL